jgi:hypothetical protein
MLTTMRAAVALRAACGEMLTWDACVLRATRDDLVVRERRASRVAR